MRAASVERINGHEFEWQPTEEQADDVVAGSVPVGVQEQARQTYRDAAAAGEPISGRKLGQMYDRSERWGRDRINEARAELRAAAGVETAAADSAAAAAGASERAESKDTTGVRRRVGDGAVVAGLGLVAGVMVSIGANVLHAMALSDQRASWLVAAFWPLALLLSIEIITRVTWPRGWLYAIARYGGFGMVALVAAVVSYRHMSELLALWGEDGLSAHIGPLAVDGLVVCAATALLAARRNRADR